MTTRAALNMPRDIFIIDINARCTLVSRTLLVYAYCVHTHMIYEVRGAPHSRSIIVTRIIKIINSRYLDPYTNNEIRSHSLCAHNFEKYFTFHLNTLSSRYIRSTHTQTICFLFIFNRFFLLALSYSFLLPLTVLFYSSKCEMSSATASVRVWLQYIPITCVAYVLRYLFRHRTVPFVTPEVIKWYFSFTDGLFPTNGMNIRNTMHFVYFQFYYNKEQLQQQQQHHHTQWTLFELIVNGLTRTAWWKAEYEFQKKMQQYVFERMGVMPGIIGRFLHQPQRSLHMQLLIVWLDGFGGTKYWKSLSLMVCLYIYLYLFRSLSITGHNMVNNMKIKHLSKNINDVNNWIFRL